MEKMNEDNINIKKYNDTILSFKKIIIVFLTSLTIMWIYFNYDNDYLYKLVVVLWLAFMVLIMLAEPKPYIKEEKNE